MSLSIALQDGRTLPTETRRGPIGVVDRVLTPAESSGGQADGSADGAGQP